MRGVYKESVVVFAPRPAATLAQSNTSNNDHRVFIRIVSVDKTEVFASIPYNASIWHKRWQWTESWKEGKGHTWRVERISPLGTIVVPYVRDTWHPTQRPIQRRSVPKTSGSWISAARRSTNWIAFDPHTMMFEAGFGVVLSLRRRSLPNPSLLQASADLEPALEVTVSKPQSPLHIKPFCGALW